MPCPVLGDPCPAVVSGRCCPPGTGVARGLLLLKANRFGFEQIIAATIPQQRRRAFEIPTFDRGRIYQEGKKITRKDGLQGAWCVLRYSLRKKQRRTGSVALVNPSQPAFSTGREPLLYNSGEPCIAWPQAAGKRDNR